MSDTFTSFANPAAAADYSSGSIARGRLEQAQLALGGHGGDKKAMRQTAEDFESVFIAQMLQPIFDTIPDNSLMGSGPGHKVYQSMFVNELGKQISQSGGVGIADHVMDMMIRMQES